MRPSSVSGTRARPWLLGGAVGLLVTLCAFLLLRGYEQSQAVANFRVAASESLDQFDNNLDLAMSQVNAVGAFFDATGGVSRNQFSRIVQPLIAQTPALHALEWVPRVPAGERAAYVESARRDGYSSFEFTERMSQGHMAVAALRPESFPVYYIEPIEGNREAFGFDLASSQERLAILARARDSGRMLASEGVILVQEKAQQYGFLLMRPVYRGGRVPEKVADRQAALSGYVIGVFRVAELVREDRPADSPIELAVLDARDDSRGRADLLFPTQPSHDATLTMPAPFRMVRPVEVAGRLWTVVARARPGEFAPAHSGSSATLLLGVLLSLLLAVFLREREQRLALIESRVAERTRELERERHFSNAVFDSAGSIILVINRLGEIVRFNKAAQNFTGYRFEEVVGRPFFWSRFLLPEQREGVEQVFARFRARALPTHYVNYWLGRGDERRLFEWTNTFLGDELGEPEYLVTVGLDITERVRAEESLRESEAQFRQFFERNRACMLMVDPAQGTIIDANEAACGFYGWSREVFRTLRLEQINTLPSQEIREVMEDALAERRNHFEFRHRLADGSERLMEVHSTPVRVGGRDVLFSILHDITERKQAEDALQAESGKNLALLMNSVDGVHVLDERGCLVEANPAFFEMLGYAREELIGRSVATWDAQWSEDELKERVLPKLMTTRQTFETRHRRRDGSLIEAEVSASGVRIGEDWLLYCSARDVTERKRVENALHESEIKFHTMVDWTYDWEYWVAPDGGFVYITPSVERVTGYAAGEFSARPGLLDEIVHHEDSHAWRRHLREHMAETATSEVGEIEFRIVRRNGETRWVSHICRSVVDDKGIYRGRRVAVRDITDRKRAESEVRQLAYFDPLTLLPNRRLLMDRLGQAMVAGKRNRGFGALMILDLDHFKTLNDTQGHDVGDRLLIEVAKRLRSVVREEDVVARLGGDEFVILIENLGKTERLAAGQAETVAEKIRAAITLPYILGSDESEYMCTPSIGLTLFLGQTDSAEVLLKQADVALYQAKDAGRNRVRFFNPAMQAAIESRAQLESALRRALERDEFSLYFQPQVDHGGRVIGAEALIRWLSPEQGLVLPAQFIPLAEETGLIVQIGEWALRTACRQLRSWADTPGAEHLTLAVNVSARQFRQPDFVDQVVQALSQSGAEAGRLKLELTESMLLDNDEFISHMQQLDGLGVQFALDDFGTGYSSLSYLKRLPIDQLKIDQVFVRDVTHDPNDAAIVRAILAMSGSLGFGIIAEGVETEAQRLFLVENGCETFQGYLFGKPMPVEDFLRLL